MTPQTAVTAIRTRSAGTRPIQPGCARRHTCTAPYRYLSSCHTCLVAAPSSTLGTLPTCRRWTRWTGRCTTCASRSPTGATSAASTACRRRSSAATTASSSGAELLTFEEIARIAQTFVALGVEKLRITGGEPLVRRDLERLIEMLAPLGVDLTLTTNGSLLPAKARGARGGGAPADHREPRLARRRDLPGAERRRLPGEPRARGHRRRRSGRAPGEGELRRQARRQRRRARRARRAVPRHAATRFASSSTWTSATRTAGASTTSSRQPRSSRRSTPRSGSSRSRPPTGRGRAALSLPRRLGRVRRHRLGHAAVLRRLHPRAALGRGQALHLPVRAPRPRSARAAPRRRDRRGARAGGRKPCGDAVPTATRSSDRPPRSTCRRSR